QFQDSNVKKDVDIGVVDGKLKFSVLIDQHLSHEAYTNQKMERKVAGLSISVLNNQFSSLISYLSSNESTRPGLAEISTENVSLVHPAMQEGFGIG
ncbi:19774_t:CDS:2, partial [Dentiscutata erythropus]